MKLRGKAKPYSFIRYCERKKQQQKTLLLPIPIPTSHTHFWFNMNTYTYLVHLTDMHSEIVLHPYYTETKHIASLLWDCCSNFVYAYAEFRCCIPFSLAGELLLAHSPSQKWANLHLMQINLTHKRFSIVHKINKLSNVEETLCGMKIIKINTCMFILPSGFPCICSLHIYILYMMLL